MSKFFGVDRLRDSVLMQTLFKRVVLFPGFYRMRLFYGAKRESNAAREVLALLRRFPYHFKFLQRVVKFDELILLKPAFLQPLGLSIEDAVSLLAAGAPFALVVAAVVPEHLSVALAQVLEVVALVDVA